MQKSDQINDLSAALVKAQAAMEGARKDAENPAFKRDGKATGYADLASVWDAVRKPLTDNGLAVMQWPRTVEAGIEVETLLTHSSGQYISDTLWMPCTMTAHGVGSAITYARRYALMAVAGIAPVDDDGNDATGDGKPVQGRKPAPQPQAQEADVADGAREFVSKSKADLSIMTLGADVRNWWKAKNKALAKLESNFPELYMNLNDAYLEALDRTIQS